MEARPDQPILLSARTQDQAAAGSFAAAALDAGWLVCTAETLPDKQEAHVALAELSSADADAATGLRRRYPNALTILVAAEPAKTSKRCPDLLLPEGQLAYAPTILDHAEQFWRQNRKIGELMHDVGLRRQRMHQLNEISLALTAQMDEQEMLNTILSEARRIAGCEGGSLFLVQPDQVLGKSLVFKLAQNIVVDFPFAETKLPLTSDSIAGSVALTGHELNLHDVYQLPSDTPYKFNPSFDEKMGYRTQSMLTLPMRDHRGHVVGVLQFINCKNRHSGEVIPFGEETVEVLRAIASQAAVSLQKNTLLNDINQLFESFVQASVKTIEQRDPSTSGHSFRVAQSTVALLQALPKSGVARFRNLQLTDEHIREVRYAALLHDFGKVGVPEAVLVKANKLTDERLEVIRFRFELQKERLRRRAVEQELEMLHHERVDVEVARRRIHRQLQRQLSVLDQYYEWIVEANHPNVLDSGVYDHLNEIRDYAFRELDGTVGGVITDQDILALSVRRGSLTPAERRSIEAHVVYTKEFLSVLPWPPELAQVPEIAGAHHERLDGSGYPMGLAGEQIPLASQVMAVADVYDALTAMDRPYKSAISPDAAFSILTEEGKAGLLDPELVDIFIASGSYQIAKAS